MQLLFLSTVVAGGVFFLLSRRRFDLFSVAFVSSCVYFLPGFFGTVPDGIFRHVPMPLQDETYLVMSTVLAAILAGGVFLAPQQALTRNVAPAMSPLATYLALLIAAGGLVMTLHTGGAAIFSPDKEDVLSALSRWFHMFAIGASLAAVLAYLHRQWGLLLLATGLLLFCVYVGFRSTCAITTIALFLLHFHRQGPQRFVQRNRLSLIGASASAAFFFVYKLLYQLMKLGAYETVAARLTDPDFYASCVIGSEPFATQMVLNEVLRSGFATDAAYIVEGVAAQFMFFSNDFGIRAVSFNQYFQPQLFADVQGGLAANIWAQMLAAGGWPLFLTFLGFYVGVLRIGSRWLSARSLTTRAAAAVGLAYWAFYIHRNDLVYQLSLEKRVFVMWAGIVGLAAVMHQLGGVSRPRRVVRPPMHAAPRALPRPHRPPHDVDVAAA